MAGPDKHLTIAVLGANGQVGAEVSLLLAHLADWVRVIPIVRTAAAGAFLRHLGVNVVADPLQTTEAVARVLAGCDVIADFSLPRGGTTEARQGVRRTMQMIISGAPTGAAYVYASTTMAFGMPSNIRRYRGYLVARSRYAADKRYAERVAWRLGRRYSRPVYTLRLGQVHGRLQRSTEELRTLVARNAPLRLPAGGECISDVLTCVSIAAALLSIGQGHERPGLYTLVDEPPPSWREVFTRIAAETGHSVRIMGAPPIRRERRLGPTAIRRFLANTAAKAISRHKELLTGHLPLPRELDRRLRGRFALRRVQSELSAATDGAELAVRIGPIPGSRLRRIHENLETVRAADSQLMLLLDRRLPPRSDSSLMFGGHAISNSVGEHTS